MSHSKGELHIFTPTETLHSVGDFRMVLLFECTEEETKKLFKTLKSIFRVTPTINQRLHDKFVFQFNNISRGMGNDTTFSTFLVFELLDIMALLDRSTGNLIKTKNSICDIIPHAAEKICIEIFDEYPEFAILLNDSHPLTLIY